MGFRPDAGPGLYVVTDAPEGTARWDRLALVDTPDFDSVLAANRRAARQVYDRSDAVIFITDAVKYADQASWEYLERIRDRGRAAVLVVNRVRNRMSVEDFERRLEEAKVQARVLSIREDPGLADSDLLSPKTEALADIQAWLTELDGQAGTDLLLRETAAAWHELSQGLKGRLLPTLAEVSGALTRLREALEAAARESGRELESGLSVSISGELRQSLIGQIQTLFLKFDLLRYPRKIMSLP